MAKLTDSILHADRILFNDGSELTDRMFAITESYLMDSDNGEPPYTLYPHHTVKRIEGVTKAGQRRKQTTTYYSGAG